jgi:hypothetical protein
MSCILTRLVAGLRRLTRGIPEYWQTCSSRKKKWSAWSTSSQSTGVHDVMNRY